MRWGIRIIAAAAALAVVTLLIVVSRDPAQRTATTSGASENATPTSADHPASPPTVSATPDLTVYKTDPQWVWWNEQSERDPQFEWKMPISFFGKVVDEQGQPVSGTKVTLQWTDLSQSGTTEKTLISGADGRFELTGVTGKNLAVIQIQKDGYYRADSAVQQSFEYAAFFEASYHRPDRGNPVVFRLRKQGTVPPELITRETLVAIVPDGSPHSISLRTTRKATDIDGDIAIKIFRPADIQATRYDWSATVEGLNGAGLIESHDEFMFEAPAEGYEPRYTYEFPQTATDWQGRLRRRYYVSARGGTFFARVEVEFMPRYQTNAAVQIRFFVNPTGSRNLEYPPNQVLP